MPIIKSISKYNNFPCFLGNEVHCNLPLSPNAGIQANVPALADLLADEHSSLYSPENIESMIQALERRQAQELQSEEPAEPAPAPRRKKSEPETE